jgi:hypothetical protein
LRRVPEPDALPSFPFRSAAPDAQAAWAAYYAQQAAAQQAAAAQAQAAAAQPDAAAAWAHRQAALSGPHADAWRAYYAAQAAQPQQAQQQAPAVAAPASYAAATSASYNAGPASYNAVPPPSALQPLRPGGTVPPPRPPAGPPPPQAKRPPGIAAPYAVAAPRPAYIAPARPVAGAPAGGAAAAGPAAGGWPPALRAWVTRAFNSCSDAATRAWMPEPLKACIDEATAKGELWTRDWDTTPVPRPPASMTNGGGGDNAQQQQQHQPPGAWGSASYAQAQAASRAGMSYGGLSYGATTYGANAYAQHQWPLPGARSPSSSPERSRQDAWAAMRERSAAGGAAGRGRGRNAKRSRNFSDDAYGAPPPQGGEWAEDAGKRARREGRFGDGRAEGAGTAANGSGAAGTARRRALAAMQLAAAAAEGGEAEPDWDALTIKGTCAKLEKSYFRLTSAPDPATVRPAPVLAAALAALQAAPPGSMKWLYVNDQCKALRQDLTVQRIRTPLAASVYEFHARAALAAGDLAEFNQCQTVLWGLHAELGSQADPACVAEFAAYRILYAAVMAAAGSSAARALAAASRLPGERPPAVAHAAAVQRSLVANDYISFFRLLRAAPGSGRAVMAPAVERVRFAAATVATRAYRPSLPLRAMLPALGFDGPDEGGAEAAHAWLLAHGATVSNAVGHDVAEAEIDCKATASNLFIPAPENAVSHGDADLDVSDFLKAFAPPPPPPGDA